METFYVEEIYDDREIYFDMFVHLIFELGRIWTRDDFYNMVRKERVHRTLKEFFEEMNIPVTRLDAESSARRTFSFELREYMKKAMTTFNGDNLSLTAKCDLLTRLGVALDFQIYYRRNG